jgi:hypothetical protein
VFWDLCSVWVVWNPVKRLRQFRDRHVVAFTLLRVVVLFGVLVPVGILVLGESAARSAVLVIPFVVVGLIYDMRTLGGKREMERGEAWWTQTHSGDTPPA